LKLKALITLITATGSFNQIEPYDGQFEAQNISEWQIIPPACFVEVGRSDSTSTGGVCDIWTIDLIIVSSHISGSGSSDLSISDLIALLKSTIHVKDLFYDGSHLGRMFQQSAENYINLPGLKVWKLTLTLN